MRWYVLILFSILFASCATRSRPTICEYLKLDNCNNSKRSLSRSAGASLPSVNSAAFNNPAAVALSRGLGIESIHYQGIAQLGLVTGTGRIGAAISNYPSDGTFFGNIAVESTNEFRKRTVLKKAYEADKIALATAINIFGGKSKKGLQLDLGLIYHRQTEIEKDYYGAGLILSYNKFISFGYSSYTDIHYQELSGKFDDIYDQFGNPTSVIYPTDPNINISEEYRVENTVFGLKFSTVAIDYIKIKTTSLEDSFDPVFIDIYNLSYFYRKWIFSYGRRFESSFKEYYDKDLEEFIIQENKSDSFLGAQYATQNGFLLGAFINYYLHDELSLGLTYFF